LKADSPPYSKINLHNKKNIGRFAFTAIYLFIVYWFQKVDIWNNYFSERSSLYIFYNVFRVLFIIYFGWIHYYIGNIILSTLTKNQNKLQLGFVDLFLISSYVGASLSVVVMFCLGILHLYYLPILIGLTAPIVFISFPEFKCFFQDLLKSYKNFYQGLGHTNSKQVIIAKLFILIISVQIIFLFISKGLLPDLKFVDTVAHYMPYFQQVILNHGLKPNIYFFHFFYTKGAGLHYLSIILSDIQSLQLTSFYLFSLSAILLFNFIKKIFGNNFNMPLISVIIYLSSGVTLVEFQKIHIGIASFMIFIVYMTVLLPTFPPSTWRLKSFIQGFVVVSLTIMSPVSLVFTFPILSLQVLRYRMLKKNALSKYSLVSLGTGFTVLALILVYNYYIFGLFEMTPMHVFYKLRNESIMRKWVSPNIFVYLFEIYHGVKDFTNINYYMDQIKMIGLFKFMYGNKIIPFPVFILLIISFVVFFAAVWRPLNREILNYIIPVGFIIFYVFLLKFLFSQTSLDRYSCFLYFFEISLCFILLKYFRDLFAKYTGANHSDVIILAIATIGAFYSLFNFNKWIGYNKYFTYKYYDAKYAFNTNNISFLVGKTSYEDMYDMRWNIHDALEIQKEIGYDKKVLVLNYIPGFTGIPKSKFSHWHMNDCARRFDETSFGSPDKAMKAMKELDINYFYLEFDRPLFHYAYSPLFEPANLKKYFNISWRSKTAYLLTWKSKENIEINDDLIKKYNLARQGGGRAYKSFISKIADKKRLLTNDHYGNL
jgi:hypothetical protein